LAWAHRSGLGSGRILISSRYRINASFRRPRFGRRCGRRIAMTPLTWPARRPALALAVATAAVLLPRSAQCVLGPTCRFRVSSRRTTGGRGAGARARPFSDRGEAADSGSVREQEPRPDQLIAFAERLQRQVADDPNASSLIADVTWRADATKPRVRDELIVPHGSFI